MVFQNRTEPAVFLKTEPNLKNPLRTSLECLFFVVGPIYDLLVIYVRLFLVPALQVIYD